MATFAKSVLTFAIFHVDEGVYVNTNGELVRHAVLQWGETPYAIGRSCYSE